MAFKLGFSTIYASPLEGTAEGEALKAEMGIAAKVANDEVRRRDYKCPVDKETYWAVVDDWIEDFILLGHKYLKKEVDEVAIRKLKDSRDPKITSFFNSIWWDMPDNGSIHGNPAFGPLCDCCSESHILFDGNDGPEEE